MDKPGGDLTIVPASRCSAPMIQRSRVDFPTPFGPIKPTCWLSLRIKLTSLITVTAP